MLKVVFLIALFVAQCFCQWSAAKSSWNRLEFQTIGSVVADPCHIGLSEGASTFALNHDCTTNEFPDTTHSIIAPTSTSALDATPKSIAASVGAPIRVQVTGHFLLKNSGYGIRFGLSTTAGRCSAMDPSKSIFSGDFALPNPFSDKSGSILITDLSWFTSSMEFEVKPRSICFQHLVAPGGIANSDWFYTGVKWRVSWVTFATCPPPLSSSQKDLLGVLKLAPAIGDPIYSQWPMNATLIAIRTYQTTTCSVSAGTLAGGLFQCYNAKVQDCCGGNLFNPSTQKCCSATTGIVQWKDAPCPCTMDKECPQTLEPFCCLPNKYLELTQVKSLVYSPLGQCYNKSIHACCDTGRRYDPGSDQCCLINGVQSLDTPCPCGKQSDCQDPNGATTNSNVDCCLQYTPTPWESALYGASACSKYANFPNGTGHYSVQPCLGSCIDTRFQICCNGVACMKNVEYCCNSTCCNKYVGTCHSGLRPGAPGNWHNGNDYGVAFLQCTTIEQLNTVKAFWIFVLPTELMFASFFGLALCLSVAAKASEGRRYSILEIVMLLSAILCVLFAVTHFFAPIYKYGVVVVVASLLAIVTSAVRVRWLNVLCIVVQLITVIYLFDFVDGNYYLQLNSNRNFATGLTDPDTMGVLHAIKKMWPSPEGVGNALNNGWCTTYYKYFNWDPQLHDTIRSENPAVTTFGYCSRAWATALYLFTAAIMDLVILQLVVDILALIFRFQESPVETTEKQVA